jgi:excinuclease ABC subunit A
VAEFCNGHIDELTIRNTPSAPGVALKSGKTQMIRLRGVAVHNLRDIDLDLPHHQLIAFCGVSGSGKTSLALDTLYAEGQRRYIESFSAYTRQFLEQLPKPAAAQIDGIPPAIAVTQKNPSRSQRATVGTATEIRDYLGLLFARIGNIQCYGCGNLVRHDSPESIADQLETLPEATRFMIGFTLQVPEDDRVDSWLTDLTEQGFVRALLGDKSIEIEVSRAKQLRPGMTLTIVVDRLTAGQVSQERRQESLETALAAGLGTCVVLVEAFDRSTANLAEEETSNSATERLGGHSWRRLVYSTSLRCHTCEIDYPELQPPLFNFNSPLGACPECEGFGNVVKVDMERVVPNRSLTLREGAIVPWNTPAYAHELEELIALSGDYGIPLDIPYSELSEPHRRLICEGIPERDFGGLDGFFRWLERRKYKVHLRVFLSRWKSYYPCPTCAGMRLRPESLAVRIGEKNIAELTQLQIEDCLNFFAHLRLNEWQKQVSAQVLSDITSRLSYLTTVGVGYLTLNRPLRTLSSGEAQRVTLTAILGSNLVNMLYVLDEPSIGLHPQNIDSLANAMTRLRDRENTVVVVEHEEEIIRRADQVVELGPEAGRGGGHIVFQGTPGELETGSTSSTGQWLSGKRGLGLGNKRRPPQHGQLTLVGARGNNLRDVTIDIPLGLLCLVTGVSGAGKSTLINETIFPALTRCLNSTNGKSPGEVPLDFDSLLGTGQLNDVILIDSSPVGRSPRSNPVTFIKAFDPIRQLFAEQPEAVVRGFSASHFSFNVDGGRCEACRGDGLVQVDMQFMADIYLPCRECGGSRYRKEVREVKYRGKDIAEVLEMTVREAFTFFRGHNRVLAKLKLLLDVGLDYLCLGQSATTLSTGEAQRLKLATYLGAGKRGRTLFLLDEPTTGLHFSDILKLLDCFDALVDVGHSLVVVEHNLQLMTAADWLIDLGPGAAESGGNVVVAGTPEDVANCPESVTGWHLKKALARLSSMPE